MDLDNGSQLHTDVRREETSRFSISAANTGMFKIGIVIAGAVLMIVAILIGIRILNPPEQVSPLDITLQPNAWPDSQDGVSFAIIGDYGTGETDQYRVSRKLIEAYQQQPYSLLLTVGDNVYGADIVDRVADVIDAPYGPLFEAGVKFLATLGNHDLSDGGEMLSNLNTLGMPSRYYRFTKGPMDFFALDSNSMSSDQVDWLEQQLNCSEKRWQIVFLHHPLSTLYKR